MNLTSTTCRACEKPLPPLRSRGQARKWCSPSCAAWARRNPGMVRPLDSQGRPAHARVAGLERVANCSGCGQGFVARRASTRAWWPRLCSPECQRLATQRGCVTRDAAQACRRGHPLADDNNVYIKADGRGRECRTCRKARQRHWDHLRRAHRQAVRRELTLAGDITPGYELELRRRAKRCPLCNVRLADVAFLPSGKELDHIVPVNVGGTHTIGNVRIICRGCNGRRPKNGSDYEGPVTLFALAEVA